MFEKFLQEIGLSEKEAKIYVSLLQVDSESINDLAKKTGVNRTTVYPVLESLAKKGLVSEVRIEKKTAYQAESPERLETFIERQKVILHEQSGRLRDIIPQMKSIQRETGEKPIIKLFQGRDGAISAYKEFFNFENNIEKDGFYILNSDLLAEVFTTKEMQHFRELRKDKKVNTVIVYNRKAGEHAFEKNKMSVRIDEKKYPIACDVSIIDDTVVISTLGQDVHSLLIKSKDLSETLISLITYICEKNKKADDHHDHQPLNK